MVDRPERKEIPEKHGVVFVIIKKGKLQLEKRTERGDKFFGLIIIPGGKIEPGETQEDALKREALQERGILVEKYHKLGIVDSVESDGALNIRHIFRIEKSRGRMRNVEERNQFLEASLGVARLICRHPVTQRILNLVEEDLSRQHS